MAILSVFGNREIREKKTLANKEYYKTLIESKKEPTFLADTEGDLFLLNKKAQSLTGYSDEEIREYHVRDIFITIRPLENPFDVRQFSEFSSRFYMLDARRYLIPVMIDFREIEGQKFFGTIAPIQEKELEQGTFAANNQPEDNTLTLTQSAVSITPGRWTVEFEHEIRNLLNSILGFGAIAAKMPTVSKDKKLLLNIESIIKSGTQLKTLVNKISIGDADSYEVSRTPCPIAPILQKAQILLDPVARQNNISIQVMQPEEITVFTDEFLLLELLKFLLTKALLYTRKDQVIAEVSIEPETGRAVISIDNLGQDIPQGIINFIRRANNQEKYDLNNPVLLQSPEIKSMLNSLNLIDGKITFSTGEKSAETAKISLPLAPGDEYPDDLSQLEQQIRDRSLKLLIVEDDKFNSAILEVFLDNVTMVSIAFSGNEALNITEGFYNKGVIFNAVIMDIGLPKPWDGILLKAEMEKRWPEYQKIPFLAQTAFTAKSYTDRITAGRFRQYLVKPINRSDLLRFIVQHAK